MSLTSRVASPPTAPGFDILGVCNDVVYAGLKIGPAVYPLKYGEENRLAIDDVEELDTVVPSVSTSSAGVSGVGLFMSALNSGRELLRKKYLLDDI